MSTDKRNTIQKRLVLEAVNTLHNHPTAEDVYVYITRKYGAISKATVYNNLQSLALSGEILALNLSNEPIRYDHQTFKHYHFLCKNCGKLFDSDIAYDERFIGGIKSNSQFQIEDINVVLTGVCPGCIELKLKGEQQ